VLAGKRIPLESAKEDFMRRDCSNQEINEIQLLFEVVDGKKVSLIGEFNNWNPDVDPMQRDENETWMKAKMLPPGNIEYKFWVDGEWMEDPDNLRACPNCFGTQNNVVKVIL
jgi:1,4-alpha-glucan branching enzyme